MCASSLLFSGCDEPLLIIASYLERFELPAFFRICKRTASLAVSDLLWQSVWLWDKNNRNVPLFAASWKDAHSLVVKCKVGDLVPIAIAEGSQASSCGNAVIFKSAHDESLCTNVVTCFIYGPNLLAFGYSNGAVRLMYLPDGLDNGISEDLEFGAQQQQSCVVQSVDLQMGAGSIRHMLLHTETDGQQLLYVGSWRGAVHVVDLNRALPSKPNQKHDQLETSVCGIIRDLGGPVYNLALSGSVLFVSCGDSSIYVFDLSLVTTNNNASALSLGRLDGHSGAVTDCIVQAPPATDNVTMLKGDHGAIAPWKQKQQGLRYLAFSASYDGTIRVWDVRLTEPPMQCNSSPGRAHSPDNAGEFHAERTCDSPLLLLSHRCLSVMTGHQGPVWSIASAGSRLFSASADGTVRVWGTRVQDVPVADGTASSGTVQTSRHFAVASSRAQQFVCEQVITPPSSHQYQQRQITCLRVAGECLIAGGSGGQLHCFSVLSGEVLWRYATCPTPTHVASPSPSSDGSSSSSSSSSSGSAIGGAGFEGPGSPGAASTSERDGIRRLDLVRDRLFVCTTSGSVKAYRFGSRPSLAL